MHEMAFGSTTNRWIARHAPDRRWVGRDQGDLAPHPRRRHCGFDARVAAANYRYVNHGDASVVAGQSRCQLRPAGGLLADTEAGEDLIYDLAATDFPDHLF